MEEKDSPFDYSSWSWGQGNPVDGASGSRQPSLSLDDLNDSRTPRVNLAAADDEGIASLQSGGVGDPLRGKFADLITTYPNGISVHRFLSVFKNSHGYYPNFADFGYSSMEGWCRSLRDIFFVVNSPLGEPLLFSAYLNGKINPLELLEKTWKQIRALLQQSKCLLKIDDIPGKLSQCCKVRIDPSDWHLGDEVAFYNFCLNEWPSASSVEPTFLENSIDDPCQKVLIQRNARYPSTLVYDKKRQEMEKLELKRKAIVTKEVFQIRINASEFVRLGDVIQYVTDDLQTGRYYKCLAGALSNPGHFYVICCYNWHKLENLMDELQDVYGTIERSNGQVIPEPDTLVVGLYVAAKWKTDLQWHRAIIMEKKDNETFEVCNIDYGDIFTVNIQQIRYLTTGFFRRLRAQAIRCSAKLGRYYNADLPRHTRNMFNRGIGWTEKEGNIMRSMVYNDNLAIKFISKIHIEEVPIWQVFVHALVGTSRMVGIKGLHIERQVIEASRRIYVLTDDDETDTCEDVEIVPREAFPYGQ